MNHKFMRSSFKKFIQSVKEIKLSESEKSISLSKIKEYIAFNPIRGKVPMPRERNYVSIFEVGHFVKATALLLIIAVVAGGAGVSYAASSALPGEKLYNVKVNVNERIEDGLAFSTEAKIGVQSKKVERRLEEAQVLVKEKKLSNDNKKIVEDKLDEHLLAISKEIDILKKSGDVEVVLETTSKLTPVLEAHRGILKEKESGAETLIAKVEDTLNAVEAEENEIIAVVSESEENNSAAMTMSLASDTGVETKLAKQTQDTLDEISEEIEEIVDTRIKKAKEKIREIKKDVAEMEEAAPVKAPEIIQTTPEVTEETIVETKIETDVQTQETLGPKTTLPSARSLSTTSIKQTASTPAEEEVAPTAEVTLKENAEFTPDADVEMVETKEVFDVHAKIKEAERLLREADDLFDRGKFKDALEIAQEVNRIASEIEVHQKLKALELAQKMQLSNQKAETLEIVK